MESLVFLLKNAVVGALDKIKWIYRCFSIFDQLMTHLLHNETKHILNSMENSIFLFCFFCDFLSWVTVIQFNINKMQQNIDIPLANCNLFFKQFYIIKLWFIFSSAQYLFRMHRTRNEFRFHHLQHFGFFFFLVCLMPLDTILNKQQNNSYSINKSKMILTWIIRL